LVPAEEFEPISQVGQDGVVNYGGRIGINVAFGAPPAVPVTAKY
jgi:hypothetical protein